MADYLINNYPEFMNFYWDWGIFLSGLLVFCFGWFMGWVMRGEREEKNRYAEKAQ